VLIITSQRRTAIGSAIRRAIGGTPPDQRQKGTFADDRARTVMQRKVTNDKVARANETDA
jgi:hypothetical protein